MQKKINIILGVSFSLFVILILWLYYLVSHNIGEITYNKETDTSNFKICNKETVFQYYSVGTSYTGGRKNIKKELTELLSESKPHFKTYNGYITFRFIVNCKGEIDFIRIKEVNKDYQKVSFPDKEVLKLKKAILQLKNWQAGTLKNGKSVDSYYQINFKIKNGIIQEIF